MSEQERRIVVAGLEVRKAGEAALRTLVGYAAKFNVRSEDLGGWVEEIKPGAFDSVLQGRPDVRALVNHDPSMVLGRSTAGTLRLSADGVGLRAEMDLPDTQPARDIAVSVERGDVDQMSFGFRVAEGGALWDLDADPAVRTVNSIAELLDVSIVTYPAYPQTEVGLRSLKEARAAVADGHRHCGNCGAHYYGKADGRGHDCPRHSAPVERLAREARWNELGKEV
jgi:HK97 family phage prohead protease